MKITKLHKKIDELLEMEYTRGYDDGYEAYKDDLKVDEIYDEGNDNGVDVGRKLEREYIINLIKEDQRNGTLGFIQYKRLLLEILEDVSE